VDIEALHAKATSKNVDETAQERIRSLTQVSIFIYFYFQIDE
jgi:hypothetical protein